MKLNKLYLILALAVFVIPGCSKNFETFDTNPNQPTTVPPNLVLTGVLGDLNADDGWSSISRWNQFDICNYNYYGDQRYDWTGATWNYITLNNVQRMEQEASRIGLPEINPYSAVGKFFKAFFYYRMSSLNGDVPLNDALKSIEAPTPAYNSQKEVF